MIGFNQAHVDKFLETVGVASEIGHRFPDYFIPEERTTVTALMKRALKTAALHQISLIKTHGVVNLEYVFGSRGHLARAREQLLELTIHAMLRWDQADDTPRQPFGSTNIRNGLAQR